MSKGYSSTYLYNRINMLTWNNRYGENDFSEQMNSMLNRLSADPIMYKVIYAFKGAVVKRTFFAINKILGLTFINKSDMEPLVVKNKEFNFDLDIVDGFIMCEIDAYDYISAAWNVNDMISGVEDLVAFEHKRNIFEVSSDCLVKVDAV